MLLQSVLSLLGSYSRRCLATVLTLALVLGVTHAAAQQTGSSVDRKTLRVAVTLPFYMDRFDPNTTFFSTDDIILNPLFDKFMTLDRSGNQKMMTAKSVEFLPDGVTIEIVLKGNSYWSYGEPVVASDYVRGLQRAAMANSRAVHLMAGIRGSEQWAAGDYSTPLGIEAPDDKTILIRLSRPFGYDPTNLMNMHANPYPPPAHQSGALIPSNGPYMIQTMAKDRVVLARNPYYREEIPYFDRIEFVGFSYDVAVDYFLAGKSDILLGPLGKHKKWLLEKYRKGVIETGLPRKHIIVLASPNEHTPAALKDPEFRRALYVALERRAFEKSDFNFQSQWQCGFIPVKVSCSDERKQIWHEDIGMDERLRQAKDVVKRAGYSPENPLKLTLVVPTSIRGYSEIASFVKSSWHEIGVDVELQEIPNYAEAFKEMKTGHYNLLVNSFYQMAPHQYIYRAELFGDWTLNMGPRSTYLDDLVLRTSRSQGDEFAKLVLEAERYMMKTITMIPVVSDPQIGFHADWLAPNQEHVAKLHLRYFTPK